jgi:O-antigen/teichoic acid export membrane protein
MKSVVQVFSLDLLSRIVLGVSAILLIRYMPPDQYATFTIALSATTVIGHMMTTGFNRTFIIGYNRLGLGRAPSAFLLLQIAFIAVLAAVLVPFAARLHGLYPMGVALVLATCLAEFARTSFQCGLCFFRFSSVEILRAVVLLAGVGVLIATSQSIRAFDVLAVHTAALFVVFLLVFARRLDWREFRQVGLAARWARTIAAGTYRYLFGYTILVAIMTQADVFLLRGLAGPGAVATYGSAFRYYTLLSLALGAVHTVFLPLIKSMQSEQELHRLLSRHRRLVLAFAPAVLAGAVLSRWIIPMIDMGKYPEAVTVFQILSVSSIISFAFAPHVNVLLRFEDFRYLLGLTGASLAADVVCNLMLVPRLGAAGAALATLTAFGVMNTGVYLRARWRLRSNAGEFAFGSPMSGVPNLG